MPHLYMYIDTNTYTAAYYYTVYAPTIAFSQTHTHTPQNHYIETHRNYKITNYVANIAQYANSKCNVGSCCRNCARKSTHYCN